MKEETKTLSDLVKELFTLMGVDAKTEVSYDEENKSFNVNVEAAEATGLLIGKKGDSLSSLQTVIGMILSKKLGEWHRVVVNVGDYREKEEDYLKNLADSALTRAKETGETQRLYNLNAWQRRVIHVYLADYPEVVSESEGEGEERCLLIKLKNS